MSRAELSLAAVLVAMREQGPAAANAAHLLLIDGDPEAAPFTWLPLREVAP